VSHALEQLADERIRGHRELVSQLRQSRRQRVLRRATRMERKAERRLIDAWRRAAALRARAGLP
jgi:predicted metal-dependent hydrolase